jgi:hypothetical protein
MLNREIKIEEEFKRNRNLVQLSKARKKEDIDNLLKVIKPKG